MPRRHVSRRYVKPDNEEESVVKKTLEPVAKKVYSTAKPVVDKVKQGGEKVLKRYLNATNKLADKVKNVLPDELEKPRYSSRGRRRGR